MTRISCLVVRCFIVLSTTAMAQAVSGERNAEETYTTAVQPPSPPVASHLRRNTRELQSSPPVRGKKGACFWLRGDKQMENMNKILALQPYWFYSWDWRMPPFELDGIDFVPMLWGVEDNRMREPETVQDKLTAIKAEFDAGRYQLLLAYNEPGDPRGDVNLTPQGAIETWPYLEATGMPLASPAPKAIYNTWMQTFMRTARQMSLRIDYIAVHWYKDPDPQLFKDDMAAIFQRYGSRPLIISEFGVADWTAKTVQANRFYRYQVLNFAKEVLPWLEAQSNDFILGYSWYPFRDDSPVGAPSALFNATGHLTALGRYYQSVSTDNPSGDQSIKVKQ